MLVALAAGLALATTGAGSARAAATLTVFAAADLAFALRDIAARFEETHHARVTLVLGSTGHLARQIALGAPADVFFAANERFVDDLIRDGALVAESRTLYAQGRLVLATRRGHGPRLTTLEQLAVPEVRRVAIANPRHAPYGQAAEQALRAVGVWDRVRSKLVFGDHVRHALQFLETGGADAAIIALSLASVPGIEVTPIAPALHAPLNQFVAVVTRSARPDLGRAFIGYVNGPQGRPIMKKYGFVLPGEL